MRLTALWLSAQRRAIERVDQCVASAGRFQGEGEHALGGGITNLSRGSRRNRR
jgi:hypothetical protein